MPALKRSKNEIEYEHGISQKMELPKIISFSAKTETNNVNRFFWNGGSTTENSQNKTQSSRNFGGLILSVSFEVTKKLAYISYFQGTKT